MFVAIVNDVVSWLVTLPLLFFEGWRREFQQ